MKTAPTTEEAYKGVIRCLNDARRADNELPRDVPVTAPLVDVIGELTMQVARIADALTKPAGPYARVDRDALTIGESLNKGVDVPPGPVIKARPGVASVSLSALQSKLAKARDIVRHPNRSDALAEVAADLFALASRYEIALALLAQEGDRIGEDLDGAWVSRVAGKALGQ